MQLIDIGRRVFVTTATVKYLDHFTFEIKQTSRLTTWLAILQIDKLKRLKQRNKVSQFQTKVQSGYFQLVQVQIQALMHVFSNKGFPGSKVKCFQFDL